MKVGGLYWSLVDLRTSPAIEDQNASYCFALNAGWRWSRDYREIPFLGSPLLGMARRMCFILRRSAQLNNEQGSHCRPL
jgi:hypothetical protein